MGAKYELHGMEMKSLGHPGWIRQRCGAGSESQRSWEAREWLGEARGSAATSLSPSGKSLTSSEGRAITVTALRTFQPVYVYTYLYDVAQWKGPPLPICE